jgi:hypothetical protein
MTSSNVVSVAARFPAEFLTLHAADAMKASEFLRFRLAAFRAAGGKPAAAARLLRRAVEAHLERECGRRPFAAPAAAAAVEEALLLQHGKRADLLAWSVRANHVRILFRRRPGATLRGLVAAWRGAASRSAALATAARPLFARDPWHRTLVEDDEIRRAQEFLEGAGRGPFGAPSSARFRTVAGTLDLERLGAIAKSLREEARENRRRATQRRAAKLVAEEGFFPAEDARPAIDPPRGGAEDSSWGT